ncbi:MAG: hypothetical protein R2727_04760 [Bacteroidales bacterium]
MLISNIEVNSLIKDSFDFIPGRILTFKIENNGVLSEESWEVSSDEYNNSYLRSVESGSIAYFVNDGNMFSFRHYDGNRKDLLYWFSICF